MTSHRLSFSERRFRHRIRLSVLLLCVFAVMLTPRPARALLGCLTGDYFNCSVAFIAGEEFIRITYDLAEDAILALFGHTEDVPTDPGQSSGDGLLGNYQSWLAQSFSGEGLTSFGLGSALEAMTEQFTVTMMQQVAAVGAILDAQDELKTQLLFQRLTAQAHKDYQPSMQMCLFGTAVRDLGAAEANGVLTASVLASRQLAREMEQADGLSGRGPGDDRQSRLQEFKDRYCNVNDNNYQEGKATTGLGSVCGTAPTPATVNRDVDYLRTILLPRTLAIDFTSTTASDDQKDVLALSNNLYASDLVPPLGSAVIRGLRNQQIYMGERALTAKRSVAETSFNAIVGMKTQGSAAAEDGAEPYLAAIMKQLGVTGDSNPDIALFLGKRPSYMAQLELLSKFIYMRPQFYTDLYDTPANVKRRGVAMQAIGVMLDRDIFNSHLRSEQIMSQLLELRLQTEQGSVTNSISALGR